MSNVIIVVSGRAHDNLCSGANVQVTGQGYKLVCGEIAVSKDLDSEPATIKRVEEILAVLKVQATDSWYLLCHRDSLRVSIPHDLQEYEIELTLNNQRKKIWAFHHGTGRVWMAIEDFIKKLTQDDDCSQKDEFVDEFLKRVYGDPTLEASIQLWKSLSVLGIKIKRGGLTEDQFKKEIQNIRKNKKVSDVPEIANHLNDFTSIDSFRSKMTNESFCKQLFPDSSKPG